MQNSFPSDGLTSHVDHQWISCLETKPCISSCFSFWPSTTLGQLQKIGWSCLSKGCLERLTRDVAVGHIIVQVSCFTSDTISQALVKFRSSQCTPDLHALTFWPSGFWVAYYCTPIIRIHCNRNCVMLTTHGRSVPLSGQSNVLWIKTTGTIASVAPTPGYLIYCQIYFVCDKHCCKYQWNTPIGYGVQKGGRGRCPTYKYIIYYIIPLSFIIIYCKYYYKYQLNLRQETHHPTSFNMCREQGF